MATRNLLTISRHRRPLFFLLPSRYASTSISPSTISSDEISSAQSPPFLLYDQISAAVNSKLRRLENPDPRFLRRASPHPVISDHSPILTFPETRTTTLDNGLRVATESALASQYAAIAVSVEAGSRFDPKDASGAATFLQRIISNRKIATEIEKLGGFSTGSTTREKTTFLVRVAAKDVPKALEILSTGLQSPNLDDSWLGAERSALLRERDKVEPQQEEVIFDHLHATAFQYTPLGRTIVGPVQNISTITKEHLENFMSTHYTSPRIVISASGAVKHEDVVNQVKKLFTSLPTDPTTASQLVAKEPVSFTGSEVRIIDDDLPLARFAVAFNGASWTDPDSLALMVMQKMLGSVDKDSGDGKHMGSELSQMVAINQIAESMKAFSFNYKDTGLFGVYAIAEPDCLDDLSYAIMSSVSKLSYRVLEADVTRACNQLKSSLLRVQGSNAVAEDIGCQMLTYRRKIPGAELFARIDAVDATAIKRVANRFIFDQDIAIAAMGPIKKLPDYNWFRRRTYLNRY